MGAVLTAEALPRSDAAGVCAHCGEPSGDARFCCPGCAAAFDAIHALGLGNYYRARVLDPALRRPRPADAQTADLARFVTETDGVCSLVLALDGLQCGACVWLIENVLAREPDLVTGRVNLTTRRLKLAWRGVPARAGVLVGRIAALGYRLVPFDPSCLAAAEDREGRRLMRALGVAGFAAGNVMLLSLAGWIGPAQGMGPGTLALLHWLSALIALPAVAYAGMPFFASALAALRHRRANMDVPISVGVILVTGLSLAQTLDGGTHTYFDSAVTLIFFLLVGRVLDHRARGHARATAQHLLMLRATEVTRIVENGATERVAQDRILPGERILVGMGERIGADGVIESGSALIDAALITGESVPAEAGPGARVFAGTLNLGAPLTIRATATGGGTLLAECARLIEAAESRRGRFVRIADRVARAYAPAVHLAALTSFLVWYLLLGAPLAQALTTACAVLIITCPCALALAVPAVQVIATAGLMRRGILVKSPTALERLAAIDLVVFDKTGTLTEPEPVLVGDSDAEALRVAASLAAASRHPLARLLATQAGAAVAREAVEHPGQGMVLATPAGEIRLGSRGFCAVTDERPAAGPELWLTRPGHPPVCFGFAERPRAQAADTIAWLGAHGLPVRLLSGDAAGPVARLAASLGIADAEAAMSPVDKLARIEAARAQGRHVLMVGDGLNDGPALAAAFASISPASATDISQNVADVVFQGAGLGAVATVLATARRARAVMRQNIGLAIVYNAALLPVAAAGLVTPWLAAVAMSASSLLVLANAARVAKAAEEVGR